MTKDLKKLSEEMAEEWKPVAIPEYSHYFVSNRGRIKNKRGMLMKVANAKNGYKMILLRNKNLSRFLSVHRLVAMSFIKNPLNKEQVNHKNGIKHDNRVENLEWMSRSENAIHAINNGFSGGEKHKRKLDKNQILEIRKLLLNKRTKRTEIAALYKVSSTVIYNIEQGKIWKNVKI